MQALSSKWTRRRFLGACAAVPAGFVAYRRAFLPSVDVLASAGTSARGYGVPVDDPNGVIDLPAGFSYEVVSRTGDEMADGLLVPGLPDAMAAFAGEGGRTVVVRNHECLGTEGPFGPKNERLARIPTAKLYDLGAGVTPCAGGTTNFVWDTRSQSLVAQHLSLTGTLRNCAGGATPWGTWLSCEEIVLSKGFHREDNLHLQKDHGYVFEVPASAQSSIADPVPIVAMGRFMHEAVGVDARTGIVYQTEDREDGLIYRFLPKTRGRLHEGGRLQALALASGARDARNWPGDEPHLLVGAKLAVRWIDLDDVEAPGDDLRKRGFERGACRFARGEGMWMGNNEVYFVCTAGGRRQIGQLFRYVPSAHEGTANESKSPGHLELFVEPNDPARVKDPDNVTIAPWGDVILCEDPGPGDAVRLVGVTPVGALYTFARARAKGEFAGAAFSPDGSTLFVNIQQAGLTLAITGPWRAS
jgi:hypothetical protein